MPKGFNFPLRLATTAQLPTDQMQFWMPLGGDLATEEHGAPNAGVIARLKQGVSQAEAQSQLEAACLRLQSQYPATNKDLSARVVPLLEQTVGQINAPLLALLAAAGLILLLTYANVASLLLAKGQCTRIGSAHGPRGECLAGCANPSASRPRAFLSAAACWESRFPS